MKILIKVLLYLLFSFSFLYADTLENDTFVQFPNDLDIYCPDSKYKVLWPSEIKYWRNIEYTVKSHWDIPSFMLENWFIKIYKNWEEVIHNDWFSIFYNFPELWEYEIFSYVLDSQWCEYEIWKKIATYDRIFYYIWDDVQQLNLILSSFNNKNIFLKKSFLPQKNIFVEEDFFQVISDDISYFIDSEIIIVNNVNFPSIFEFLWKLWNLYWLSLSEKEIYLITHTNTNFLKRTLAQYLKKIWIVKIWIIETWDLLRFLDDISYETFNQDDKSYIQTFSISLEDVDKQYFLSYIVDFLIYNEFPINFLWLILTLSVSVLIVTIFRQIIWFSVFWVYNPILFAVSMLILWINLTFILLFIWFLSTLIIRYFNKKIYLLYSAKVSLLMIIYFIIWFLVFWLDKYFWLNYIDYSILTNAFIIFPFVFLIIISNKVFSENFSLFSKWWIFSFVEFLIVSFIIYTVITWSTFQFFMLSFPDIIFLILFINILVWRFTWLQILEYFRFMPLIKNKDEEE